MKVKDFRKMLEELNNDEINLLIMDYEGTWREPEIDKVGAIMHIDSGGLSLGIVPVMDESNGEKE